MKRKVYRVVCFAPGGSIAAERYGWGSALSAIPEIIRENFDGTWYERVARWEKIGSRHVGGASQWINDEGETLNFSIYYFEVQNV